jgi:uroporphyrinogen-III synthase
VANNAQQSRIPVVLTRPTASAHAFADALDPETKQCVELIFSPLIDIVALDVSISLEPSDAVIFTSSNGVRHAPHGDGRQAFCVGNATTELAQVHGWAAKLSGINVDQLVAEIIRIAPQQRLFHLSGTRTRGEVVGRLEQAGLQVTRQAIYDQRPVTLTEQTAQIIAQRAPSIFPLFSPRTAEQFAMQVPDASSVHVIAMSAAVAEPLRHLQVASLTQAVQPDARAMGLALGALVRRLISGPHLLEGGEGAE